MTNSKMWMGLALCGALGCAETDGPRWPRSVDEAPHAVEDGLLYLDFALPQAYLLDVTQKTAKVKKIDLPKGEKTAQDRPGQAEDEVVLLTSGVEAMRSGRKQAEVEAHVIVITAKGETARYPLGGRFEALTLSDDGRYAVAYEPSKGFSFGTGIAIVDLNKPAVRGTNPRLINVTSLDGEVPSRFVFSPEAEIAGEKRRLLFTLTTNDINIIDLGHIERGEVTIPLTLDAASGSVEPEQLLFAGDKIYVQSQRAKEVVVIQLTEASLQTSRHGFTVSLLALPVGRPLQGVTLLGEGEGQRLLAFTSSGGRIIDPRTGNGVDLELAGSYTRALLFEARSPNDDTVAPRALLYGSGAQIAFLDLSANGSAVASSAEEIPLTQEVVAADALIARKQLVLTHGGDRVSLVDLEERTVAPLTLGAGVEQTLLDVEHARLWITTGDGSLGTLDLASLVPSQILLEADAIGLVPIRGREARMAVIHPSASGFLTLFDADEPKVSDATALLGFLWDGIL